MNKKLIPLCASCAAAFAAQAESADAALPFGNLGLDCAAAQIESANSSLESRTGVKFFFDYYSVLVGNPYGGAEQGANYTGEMIFGLDFDLEKQIGWKGGSFTISGAYSSGGNLSDKIGNFFTASESYVVNGAAFYEMYFTQTLETGAGTLAVNFGRMSMSDAFVGLPVMGYLVSGGMDSTPEAIFYNSPFTSSPQATWGVNVQYSPASEVTLSAGLYQAPQALGDADWNGTEFGIHSDDGYMALFQAAWSPEFFRQKGAGRQAARRHGIAGALPDRRILFRGIRRPDKLFGRNPRQRLRILDSGPADGLARPRRPLPLRERLGGPAILPRPKRLHNAMDGIRGDTVAGVRAVPQPGRIIFLVALRFFQLKLRVWERGGVVFRHLRNGRGGHLCNPAQRTRLHTARPPIHIQAQRKQRHRRRPRPRRPADSVVLVAPPARRGKLYRDYALHVLFKA